MTIQIYKDYIDECVEDGKRYCSILKSKGVPHQVCDRPYDPKRFKEGYSYACPYLSQETIKIPTKINVHNLSGIQMQEFFICNRKKEEK